MDKGRRRVGGVKDSYIFDACAVLAFLLNEPGADKVENLFFHAECGEIFLYMHNLNLLEVYYGVRRAYGTEQAAKSLNDINILPISFLSEISGDSFIEAGRMKSSYKMSLGDAVLLGEASIRGTAVVTSDHHELDAIETVEPIRFFWIR
jgi:PIN domain nuclease of toxin-antitoxin system